MLLLQRPEPQAIERFLAREALGDFAYPQVGATGAQPPAGYAVNHRRTLLGQGDAVFSASVASLRQWQQFDTGWLEIFPAQPELRPGTTVAVLATSLGMWWLNACRIVYVIDEPAPKRRFGFAYGTLPDHAATGEERFLLEMDDQKNVWYEIFAFSRPRQVLARLGVLYLRRLQKQFGRQSGEAMQRAVQERLALPTTA